MAAALLTVFVYGTLRRGGRYHDRFCRGALAIDDGVVRGRLTVLPAGYPMLEVPEQDVLAAGTSDPAHDSAMLAEARIAAPEPAVGDWREISGEVITFDDPAEHLPALDRLEGYRPGERSLYRRVMLPVRTRGGGPVAAWAYVRA